MAQNGSVWPSLDQFRSVIGPGLARFDSCWLSLANLFDYALFGQVSKNNSMHNMVLDKFGSVCLNLALLGSILALFLVQFGSI